MSIESLEITNYQNHDSLRVDFDPELTTIIGPSDVGKSAILRALRWVCLNVPAGVSMVKEGTDGTECVLSVDGHAIRRTRMSDRTNEYALDGGKPLVAFGNGVPDSIKKVLAVDSINFVGQKEPDFWFSLSPSEVSRQLNAVVDLGVIDEANENIGKKIWQCQEAVRTSTARLDDLKKKRDAVAWVVAANVDLQDVESSFNHVGQIKEERQKLESNVDSLKSTIDRRDRSKAYYESAANVGRQWAAWQKLSARVAQLSNLLAGVRHTLSLRRFSSVDTMPVVAVIGQYQGIVARRANLGRLIGDCRKTKNMVILGRCSQDMGKITESNFAATDLTAKVGILRSRIDCIRKTSSFVGASVRMYSEAHKALEDATDGRCPICGAELRKEVA